MILLGLTRNELLHYLENQLMHFFPDGQTGIGDILAAAADEALARLQRCIDEVRMWQPGQFDYLHSSQYAIFLYFLANSIWQRGDDLRVCTKLFFLNKALNGLDCFYEIPMPEIFFIGHSVGIVLAKATYGNYLVLYQNSTVGKNHGISPIIGDRVIMYPNTAIIGACKVGNGSIISQGVSIIDRDTPGNCLVFQGEAGTLVFRPDQDTIARYFRLNH